MYQSPSHQTPNETGDQLVKVIREKKKSKKIIAAKKQGSQVSLPSKMRPNYDLNGQSDIEQNATFLNSSMDITDSKIDGKTPSYLGAKK